MTKQDQLGLLKLLSGIESIMFTLQSKREIPDHIWELISAYSEKLEKEILNVDAA